MTAPADAPPRWPWREVEGGVRLMVRLTPKSARDKIEGLGESHGAPVLLARVRAVPEKGKANAALEKLVARWIGLPRSDVTLAAGGKSRVKTLRIAGEGPEIAARLLRALDELE